LLGVDNNKHFNFGGSVGYNLTKNVTILGDFTYFQGGSAPASNYLPGAPGTVNGNYQQYGFAVRQAIVHTKTVVPYFVVGYGFARMTAGGSYTSTINGPIGSASATSNGDYLGFGGGASIYLGKGFGVRPEIRYEPLKLPFPGLLFNQNIAVVTGSIFYQSGGKSGTKKTSAPKN
jgi:hypothetical protein